MKTGNKKKKCTLEKPLKKMISNIKKDTEISFPLINFEEFEKDLKQIVKKKSKENPVFSYSDKDIGKK